MACRRGEGPRLVRLKTCVMRGPRKEGEMRVDSLVRSGRLADSFSFPSTVFGWDCPTSSRLTKEQRGRARFCWLLTGFKSDKSLATDRWKVKLGEMKLGERRSGEERLGEVVSDEVRSGEIRPDEEGLGEARPRETRSGEVKSGVISSAIVVFDESGLGEVRSGEEVSSKTRNWSREVVL